jgi:poly-beta-1,6-N-acetyl-D-glucosamine synthase
MLYFLFWASLFLLFYSFIGYGILLYLMVKLKRFFRQQKPADASYCPPVTFVVPCYNEADVLETKVNNCFALDYPKDKIRLLFITDGSTDDSADILGRFPEVTVLHAAERRGKTAAENKAMQYVTTPVVIFSDANTLVNPDAVKKIVRHFKEDKVGCVSGEKRILTQDKDVASAAGEGLYWKYESFLKTLDSELYSAVGAAGELVAFRTALYEAMPEDTILDDFIQSMYIASKGYRIVYEPDAYAVETAAASIKEELKRKIRICAGGWQSIQRLGKRLTPLQQPLLFFQYFSHRVLRWTVNPFLMLLILFSNAILAFSDQRFFAVLILQFLFYASSFAGFLLEQRQLKLKMFFLPYYFCIMNYSVAVGLVRFLKRSQSALWEKNSRMATNL